MGSHQSPKRSCQAHTESKYSRRRTKRTKRRRLIRKRRQERKRKARRKRLKTKKTKRLMKSQKDVGRYHCPRPLLPFLLPRRVRNRARRVVRQRVVQQNV